MTNSGDKKRDETADDVPAEHSTNAADDKEKKDEDASVDETSEQSMDASDPPAW